MLEYHVIRLLYLAGMAYDYRYNHRLIFAQNLRSG